MKYSAVVFATLLSAAYAIPQGASSVTAAPSAATAALTPQQSCAVNCPAGDVNCQAACVGVAHPNSSQADQTTQCAAKCDQGDGSPAATDKFAQCVQACITSHFPTSQTVGAAPAGSAAASGAASNAASATASGASAASSGAAKATGTGAQASGSATGSGAAAASSSGAANANNVQIGAAGLAGLFMAVFAL